MVYILHHKWLLNHIQNWLVQKIKQILITLVAELGLWELLYSAEKALCVIKDSEDNEKAEWVDVECLEEENNFENMI